VTGVEILSIVADPAEGGAAAEAGVVLARGCERMGLAVRGRRIVAAEDAATERALRQALEGGGVVAVQGDDVGAPLARAVLARVLGVRLVLHERTLDALAAAYARQGRAMPRRAEALALVPTGSSLLVDDRVAEPGVLVEAPGALVALLPEDGAAALVEEHVLPRLLPRATAVEATRALRLVGLEAPDVTSRLHAALAGLSHVSGHVVDLGEEVRVRLRLNGPTSSAVEQAYREAEPALRAAFGLAWYGDDEETLEEVAGRLLRARGFTVALAESCTGGLVGHRLTQVPGSSAYVERGFVVYSNAAKEALLGVSPEILARHGAVSSECADAMARGARGRAGTALGVSVTGIAGPDGATPTKPVGTVFIGLADAAGARVEHHRFHRDRAGNKALSATRALDLVRRYCLGAL
jgi:nicotinamide-nucleotide amidase